MSNGEWLVPESVAKLARRAIAAHHYPDVVLDGAETRLVLADWLKEQGDDRHAMVMGERSDEYTEDQWLKDRLWTLNAIYEAYEKRDDIAALLRRRRENEELKQLGREAWTNAESMNAFIGRLLAEGTIGAHIDAHERELLLETAAREWIVERENPSLAVRLLGWPRSRAFFEVFSKSAQLTQPYVMLSPDGRGRGQQLRAPPVEFLGVTRQQRLLQEAPR